jgi:hypothetical protein
MNTDLHDQFWMLYNRESRPAIERACRSMSRSRTDGGMDECDMIAWVDDKVWRMLETDAWPAFHDEPTPEIAAQRLREAAGLLARWSYLGLCRTYWRRLRRLPRGASEGEVSRVERLACTRSDGQRVEVSEDIAQSLDRIRASISERVRGRVAASWPERSERHRVALLLDASEPDTDALIEQSVGGDMKPNTILQMRSRSRRHICEALRQCASAICVAFILLSVSTTRANGEQTGGRKGRIVSPQQTLSPSESGQRPLESTEFALPSTARTNGGEQSGGRGG